MAKQELKINTAASLTVTLVAAGDKECREKQMVLVDYVTMKCQRVCENRIKLIKRS